MPKNSTETTFGILHRNLTIDRAPVESVARLADGRVFARHVSHDLDGTPVYLYTPWSQDPRFQEPVLTNPIRDVERLGNRADGWRNGREGLTSVDPGDLDLTSANVLFKPGKTFAALKARPGTSIPNKLEYVTRHITGDFGQYGKFDSTPPTPEEVWLLHMLPTGRRNSITLQLGGRGGTIRSQYRLTCADLEEFQLGRPEWLRHESGSVFCETLWRPAGSSFGVLYIATSTAD
jgi:hypothetical protein